MTTLYDPISVKPIKRYKPKKARFNLATQAIEYLSNKNIAVNVRDKVIQKGSYGLRVWGCIDYLVNYHSFYVR